MSRRQSQPRNRILDAAQTALEALQGLAATQLEPEAPAAPG